MSDKASNNKATTNNKAAKSKGGMNMDLKLDLNKESLKALLKGLVRSQAYIYGLALIALFGFTAYEVNQSLNVQPAAQQSAIKPLPKVTFDTKAIDSLKQLNAVTSEVPLGSLGTNSPF